MLVNKTPGISAVACCLFSYNPQPFHGLEPLVVAALVQVAGTQEGEVLVVGP